jgi:hypothetical protein
VGMPKYVRTVTLSWPAGIFSKWPLDEDALDAIGRCLRMWENFSIISSLYRVRAFSSNRLIGSSALSFFFSSTIESFLGVRERLSSRETRS